MNTSRGGLLFWRSRLAVLAAWATLVLVWRRGGHFGFSSEAFLNELPFLALLVLPAALVLPLGVSMRKHAGSVCTVLLVAAAAAESVASVQEHAFIRRCHATQGFVAVEQQRFPIVTGPRMVFIRSPDGTEAFHGYD